MKNITIGGGVAPVKRYLPELWPLPESGRIDPSPVLTHDLPLGDGAEGYAVMNSRLEGSVKVALTPGAQQRRVPLCRQRQGPRRHRRRGPWGTAVREVRA